MHLFNVTLMFNVTLAIFTIFGFYLIQRLVAVIIIETTYYGFKNKSPLAVSTCTYPAAHIAL